MKISASPVRTLQAEDTTVYDSRQGREIISHSTISNLSFLAERCVVGVK